MRLSASTLELLRQHPNQTKLDLFIYQPRTVLQCLVNSPTIAKGTRIIPYSTVSFGSYISVEPGMTLIVGTTAGGNDIGRIRIKSITASSITVSENSNIRWMDGLYLTVLRYWDVFPVFPRIIRDPNNDEDVIFYKDYDTTYTNQNSVLGTFVCAGSHRPVLMESSTGTVYYTSTGTYNLKSEVITYNWAFEGGNPTGSSASTPGNVYYTTPGDYVTRLIATTPEGASDTTYRYISVKNKIGEGSTTPTVRWSMSELSGSRNESGYTVEFTVWDDIQIDDNALVMLHAEDWYGGTRVSLGGNTQNNETTFFVGFVESGSIAYNHQYSYYTFRASSVTSLMKKFAGFSASVESSTNPNSWFRLLDMDIRRAMYHYLKWHTTVLSTTDFHFVGTDYKIQFYDVDRTSIFDAVDNLMKGALSGSLAADRQGILWAEVDPNVYPDPTGTFIPVMDITKRDWMQEPKIEERLNDDTSYIEHGGIAYSGAFTGTFSAHLSGAPGRAPSFSGGVEKLSGLAIAGQTHLNQLVGHLWANKNQQFPTVTMEMAVPTRNLDIAPQEVVSLKINSGDTVSGEVIDGIYIPSSLSWRYVPQDMTLFPSIDYAGLVNGVPGDTIDIEEDEEDGDYNFPDWPESPIPDPVIPVIDFQYIENVVVSIKDRGLFYTDEFDLPYPSWYPFNTGIDDVTKINAIELDINGGAICQQGTATIYSASSPGSAWSRIFTADDHIINVEGYAFPREGAIMGFGMDRLSGSILIVGGLVVTISGSLIIYTYTWNGSGNPEITHNEFTATSASRLYRHGYLVQMFNRWLVSFYSTGATLSTTATIDPAGYEIPEIWQDTQTFDNLSHIVLTKSNQDVNTAMLKDNTERFTLDGGGSWTGISGVPNSYPDTLGTDRFQSMIAGYEGAQIVKGIVADPSLGGLIYSNDYGVTWQSGIHTGTVTSVWRAVDDAYIFTPFSKVMAVVGLSTPTGTAVVDKTGNLNDLVTGTFQVMAIRHY